VPSRSNTLKSPRARRELANAVEVDQSRPVDMDEAFGRRALTRRPCGDEVFTANSAYDLITRGKSGMTVLEPIGLGSLPGTLMIGIHEKNYHVMPLSWVVQAGWYSVLDRPLHCADQRHRWPNCHH
jgi:hypothetical protein